MWLGAALGLLFFSACSSPDRRAVDALNSRSYANHYRNIDSTDYYARQAFHLSSAYSDGRAEALNHLAFVSIIRMDYDLAHRQLDSVLAITDNQIELLVAEVQHMRLCQRRSRNREFYEHRERALTSLSRINEERSQLSDRQRRRLIYAEGELAIVNSTYYYYVGLERQSIEALQRVNVDDLRQDTAQYLNYLYNIGAGGILTEGTSEQIQDEEMNYLNRCFAIARRNAYPYFEAQALEGIADHTGDFALADEALKMFQSYGDIYQIAGAYRTLASCYHAIGDDMLALENLELALSDTTINQAPDLVASIREQLSVAYSAVNDKPQSDYNRNIYIDLQEQTRQDRELEARAAMLDESVSQLNLMILAVLGAILLLLLLLWLFNHLNQRRKEDHQLDDLLEQKKEELADVHLRVEKSERRYMEQRAKVSLATGILPLIDRILHEVSRLNKRNGKEFLSLNETRKDTESAAADSVNYIKELVDSINEQNELLTRWIQLRQGELSLHIESFPLQPLFDIVAKSKTAFALKGVRLDVAPTGLSVKADRALTLFMLSTLADNARKFTPKDGSVTLSAQELDDSVEISVTDTGCGMSTDELAHVFDAKPIADSCQSVSAKSRLQTSHGFGLMNCKGIIEKYRKMSPLFRVSQIAAESEQGRGSRFFFRLPKGVVRSILALAGLFLFGAETSAAAAQPSSVKTSLLGRAHIYADSAYFCNVNGNYQRTLLYADSCHQCLNAHYQEQHPHSPLLMTLQGDNSSFPAEIQWLHDSVSTNYQVILDIRNECAVAALALHDWSLYNYNNKVYTQLFKELSADNTLDDYCRTMQKSRANKRIAVILLLVLFVLIVPAYYLLYYRHRLDERFRRERVQQDDLEMAADELRRAELESSNLHVVNAVLDNCLSALKHETMYYPSRIRQLVDTGDIASLSEVTQYYRALYSILIQQAASQQDRIHLHVRAINLYGQPVRGNENLLHFLFQLLSVPKSAADAVSAASDGRYVTFTVAATPASQMDYLLCRQIVRDHSEATGLRGCGITVADGCTTVVLPRALAENRK